MKSKINWITFLMIATLNVSAQEGQIIQHSINSEIYNVDREIKVSLPERYFIDTTQEFIVTYVLDAQSSELWNMTSSIINYLVRQYQVIPMITVGIVSQNRGSEFNPENDELQRFLRKEVFPLIKENYRVNDFRVVIGHSWGGAFVGNTLFSEENDMFDGYIGISPSLEAIDGSILENAKTMLAKEPIHKYFYCSMGDIGYREKESLEGILRMDSIINSNENEIAWKYETIKNTGHWSCVIPSINNGLISLSRNYFADLKVLELFSNEITKSLNEQIQEFNLSRQKKYNFYHNPSYQYLTFVADDFRIQEKYKAAKELYNLAIEKGDERVVTYFNLGLTLESLDDKDLSIEVFEKTLKILEKQKANHSQQFYKDLKHEITIKLKAKD